MWWEPWLVFGLLALAVGWLGRRLRKTLRTGKACGGCGCRKAACAEAAASASAPGEAVKSDAA